MCEGLNNVQSMGAYRYESDTPIISSSRTLTRCSNAIELVPSFGGTSWPDRRISDSKSPS